jgi:hypothetical protein
MLRVQIPEDISPVWRPIIERQVDLTLSPVRGSLSSLRIDFQPVQSNGNGAVAYRCELHGRASNGRTYSVSAQHPDGQTAIVDTLTRARRTIVRERNGVAARRQGRDGRTRR